jgi:energy-coupling factor transport system permease protein
MRVVGLSMGRYIPRQSPLHALDAAVKLVGVVLLAVASLWSADLVMQSLMAAVVLSLWWSARMPFRLLLLAMRGVLWLLALVALAQVGWILWAQSMPAGAMAENVVVLVLRLVVLLLLGLLFTCTTVPVDLAQGVESLLAPLRRLRFPVHELGLMLVFSLSFVPLFFEEARSLVTAHRVKRGSARWGWWARLRAVIPLVVPLFLGALRRADELAVALDARCFVPGARRSRWAPGRFGNLELGWLVLCVLILVASLWLPFHR